MLVNNKPRSTNFQRYVGSLVYKIVIRKILQIHLKYYPKHVMQYQFRRTTFLQNFQFILRARKHPPLALHLLLLDHGTKD